MKPLHLVTGLHSSLYNGACKGVHTMYLFFIAESCTLLDTSSGSLLGRQCPTVKAVGPDHGVLLGGRRFDIRVESL